MSPPLISEILATYTSRESAKSRANELKIRTGVGARPTSRTLGLVESHNRINNESTATEFSLTVEHSTDTRITVVRLHQLRHWGTRQRIVGSLYTKPYPYLPYYIETYKALAWMGMYKGVKPFFNPGNRNG